MQAAGENGSGYRESDHPYPRSPVFRIVSIKRPAQPTRRTAITVLSRYMVAVPLLFGRLTAADYEGEVAQDKRIDALREKIVCYEDRHMELSRPGKTCLLSAMRSP